MQTMIIVVDYTTSFTDIHTVQNLKPVAVWHFGKSSTANSKNKKNQNMYIISSEVA